MINNYIRIALRNLRKHFSYSVINITGLSLGLTVCLLLTAWVRHELSYDKFHTNYHNLYRFGLEYSFGGQTSKGAQSPTALLPALKEHFPEVENGVRFYNSSAFRPFVVRTNNNLFEESRFFYADSSFFDVFSFDLIKGNTRTALRDPNTVVLTEAMARKYFGTEDPLGKNIQVNGKEYAITGVMNNVPDNSTYKFDFIGSFASIPAAKNITWWSANYQTYVILKAGTDLELMQEKVNALVHEATKDELSSPGDYIRYNMMPLSDIYLRSGVAEPELVGNIQYVWVFSIIAALVLVVACINYINLATAKAADRAREVGVRKVSGALRRQLIMQFIGESVVLTLLAFAGAIALSMAALPVFNDLTGKSFDALTLLQPQFILPALCALLLVAVLSGIYPALVITGFNVLSILKGNFRTSGKGVLLRQALVVFQFSISILLIVGTIIILKQVDFIRSRELGYEKDNVIMLPLDKAMLATYPKLKTEMIRSGIVAEMGRAAESPVNIAGGYGINVPATNEHGMITRAVPVDEGFVPTFAIQLVEGANFDEADFERAKRDTIYSFLLNEAAVEALGYTPEAVVGMDAKVSGRVGKIKGVIRDFHFSSMHEPIGPLVLFTEESQLNYFFARLNPGDVGKNLAALNSIYSQLVPHRPFEYRFIDERFAALYAGDQRIGAVSSVFAGLAIIIACMGLLGLVSFAASQKAKEIGIRKVMGATAPGIVVLITRDFMTLIILALAVSLPLSWYLMENYWMTNFAYRAPIGVTPFVATAIGCLVIGFGTAAYQAIKAALVNPADTLRNE
jgi:putative ABC transport system permease protein